MASTMSCIVLIIYSSTGYIFNLTETIKYVRSQDKFIERLLKMKNYRNENTLYLDEIYSSEEVVFVINDISFDHINKCISDGLNLEYTIELRKRHSTVTDDP